MSQLRRIKTLVQASFPRPPPERAEPGARVTPWSQRELARPRYTPAYISALEGGKTRASIEALTHIAARLGTSPAELLGGPASSSGFRLSSTAVARLAAAEDALLSARRGAARRARGVPFTSSRRAANHPLARSTRPTAGATQNRPSSDRPTSTRSRPATTGAARGDRGRHT